MFILLLGQLVKRKVIALSVLGPTVAEFNWAGAPHG